MSVRFVTWRPIAVCLTVLGTCLISQAEPLTRDRAVELALQHNPEVTAAKATWDAARARARMAWVPADPEFEAEYEQLESLTGLGDYGERSIGVSQTLESPFKWWLNRRAASHEAQATRAAVYESTRLDVSHRVVLAFDRALSWKQKLTYAVAHDSLLRVFAAKVRLRHEAGDVPSLEVLRAEVESGRAESRVAAARNELAIAHRQLADVLGPPDRRDLDLTGSLQAFEVGLALPQVQQLGLQRRPDLRGAMSELDRRRDQRGAARAAIIPDVSIGVARHSVRETPVEEGLWRLGVSLEVPIWGATRQRGRLAVASAQLARAEAQVALKRRQVLLDTETAYLDLQTATDRVGLFDERVLREAEKAYRTAVLSYEQGKAGYLDVVDTQRTLLLTRTEYADLVLAWREAWTNLERATGGPLPR